MITGTMLSLETCKPCGGSGGVGVSCGYALVCETCGGAGMVWRERGTLARG